MDTLPSYLTFVSASDSGSYNSSTNQVTWSIGTLSSGSSVTRTHNTTVQDVPSSGYVIRNTAAASADNLTLIDSNEVRTTVSKLTIITTITGTNSLTRNLAISLLISLWGILLTYFYVEHAPAIDWRNLKFKYAVLKIKMKEKIS
mgnify:FL=1